MKDSTPSNLEGEKLKCHGKSCPITASTTINPTCTTLGINVNLYSEKLVT